LLLLLLRRLLLRRLLLLRLAKMAMLLLLLLRRRRRPLLKMLRLLVIDIAAEAAGMMGLSVVMVSLGRCVRVRHLRGDEVGVAREALVAVVARRLPQDRVGGVVVAVPAVAAHLARALLVVAARHRMGLEGALRAGRADGLLTVLRPRRAGLAVGGVG